jgi:tetratricopeptide (TPR) repeat protein
MTVLSLFLLALALPESPFQTRVIEARTYAEAGKTDEAIAAAKGALTIEDAPEVHAMLGQLYLSKKDFTNAAAEWREVVKARPYDEEAHFRLAQVYLVQQNFNGSLEVLLASKKTFNRSAQLELALGVTYYGLRQFDKAVDQFLRTIAVAPEVPQPYAFLGRMLDHAGDRMPEITSRFAAYQKQNPENYLANVLYAKVLVEGNPAKPDEAYPLVEKALKLEPNQAEAHYLMGVLLEGKGEFQAAQKQLERAIEINPNDPASHFRLARVYMKLGRPEDAEKERALHEKLSDTEVR